MLENKIIRSNIYYQGIEVFIEEKEDGTENWGLIDKNNYIITSGYSKLSEIRQFGVLEFEKNGYVGILNITGAELISECQEIIFNRDFPKAFWFKKNGKWGLINIYGNILLEPKYDDFIVLNRVGTGEVSIDNIHYSINTEDGVNVNFISKTEFFIQKN